MHHKYIKNEQTVFYEYIYDLNKYHDTPETQVLN